MSKALGDRPELREQLRSGLESARALRLSWTVVGEVAEGANIAHVIYRLAGDPSGGTGVLTFMKSGTSWYIHFSDVNVQVGTMAGFATRAVQARMQQK